jgi:hypothetical protein
MPWNIRRMAVVGIDPSSSFHRPFSINDRSTNDGRGQHLRHRFTGST